MTYQNLNAAAEETIFQPYNLENNASFVQLSMTEIPVTSLLHSICHSLGQKNPNTLKIIYNLIF